MLWYGNIKNEYSQVKSLMNTHHGADDGTWTHMKLLSLEPESSASANSATSAFIWTTFVVINIIFNLTVADALRETLAVPKIRHSLFASPNFDRCAFSHSLYRPQDAVMFKAANSATSAFIWAVFTAHNFMYNIINGTISQEKSPFFYYIIFILEVALFLCYNTTEIKFCLCLTTAGNGVKKCLITKSKSTWKNQRLPPSV